MGEFPNANDPEPVLSPEDEAALQSLPKDLVKRIVNRECVDCWSPLVGGEGPKCMGCQDAHEAYGASQ